jgi:integrase
MAGKSAVKVEEFKGRLRLRWGHQGRRYCLSLGLYDSPRARTVAEGRANVIELDLMTGNFDPTLGRYQPGGQAPVETQGLTVSALFGAFFQHRAKRFTGDTQQRYQSVLRKLEGFFGAAAVLSVDEATAERFAASLEALQPITQSQYLGLVNAAWVWGIKQGTATGNPWIEVRKIQVPPQQRPQPFTKEEITAILDGFRRSRYYSYYMDYVTFLLGTGCRSGEVVGLQWCNLTDGNSKVWIGQSVTNRRRKSTKTNKAREFKLPGYLVTLLNVRMPEDCKPNDLVFPALRGGPIDVRNFRNRAWVAVLKEAGVTYRKPYSTRHTYISHNLKGGGNPVTTSQVTGHNVRTLYDHYAADVEGGLQCSDIFY